MVEGKGINDMPYGWASENEWNKLVYRKWARMLHRCYNEEYHKTHSTYIGCSVCERWLVLSNFVEDVPLITGYDRERFLNGELELDKDKKKDKNKHYIMKYSTWLSKPENHGLAMKGKLGSECPNSKKIAQYDKQTHELIKIWDSMLDVQRELGIANQSISSCCRGKRKSAGGFIWKYMDGEEDGKQ